MVLLLRYRMNEGVKITENGRFIEVIVRGLRMGNVEDHRTKIILELRDKYLDKYTSEYFGLFEREFRFLESIHCDVRFPLQYPLQIDKPSLEFFAPREVEFSRRRMYSPGNICFLNN